MEVESLTNKELLESINKLIDTQRRDMEEQRRTMSETLLSHQRHTMEFLDDICVDLGDLHL